MSRLSKGLRMLALAAFLSTCPSGRAHADEAPSPPSSTPAPSRSAQTSPGQGIYLGLGVGVAFPSGISDQSFTRTSTTGVTGAVNQGYSPSTGFLMSGQVGYQLDQARVEGEFVYQSASRKATSITLSGAATSNGTYSVSGPSITGYSAMVNGYYDFKSSSKLVPYVGAGLGVTWLESGNQTTPGVIVASPNLNASVFTYQAKLGLSYNMTPQSALFLQYRYMGSAGFSYAGARATLGGEVFNIGQASGRLSNSSVELGARFKL